MEERSDGVGTMYRPFAKRRDNREHYDDLRMDARRTRELWSTFSRATLQGSMTRLHLDAMGTKCGCLNSDRGPARELDDMVVAAGGRPSSRSPRRVLSR